MLNDALERQEIGHAALKEHAQCMRRQCITRVYGVRQGLMITQYLVIAQIHVYYLGLWQHKPLAFHRRSHRHNPNCCPSAHRRSAR